MAVKQNGTQPQGYFSTVRLDLATKLALISSIIHSTSAEDFSIAQSVECASELIERCDVKAEAMKNERLQGTEHQRK